MSQINCDACDNLRNNAPDFVQNGVTSTICNSLANNTGLNPSLSTPHTSAEDLHDANDCLVGRMGQEVEAYDMCDWKEFMQKYVGNNYELLKAIICTLGGQFGNLENLWEFARDLCEKMDNIVVPGGIRYGAFPYNDGSRSTVVTMGTYYRKSGSPLLIPQAESEIIDPRMKYAAGGGLQIDVRTSIRCSDGNCRKYVWLEPWFYRVQISENVAINDILWSVPVTEFQEKTGVPDGFLNSARKNVPGDIGYGGGWTWREGITMNGDGRNAWIWVGIDPENALGDQYLVMQYTGSSYPLGPTNTTQWITSDQGISFKAVQYGC